MQHMGMLKRVLQYLAGTRNYAINYCKSYTPTAPLIGYMDAAHANTDQCKSSTGTVFLSAGGAISWRSKKQTLSALSTTEAEYIAFSIAGTDACWLTNLYEELGFPLKAPLLMRSDSLDAIANSTNPYMSKQTRHIELKWHSVQQLIDRKIIVPIPCQDADQTANILTKPLPCPKHKKHTDEMGLAPV